ncbi:MAG: hypothetical protein EOP48_04595 [Sphingobacteriales bacterium]|nr:MAG: hypothetical protein EOP48_04595 [Sphingobacteriales bacterium]
MSQVIDHTYKWYQEVAPRDYYIENDLERAVMHNLELLFPGFTAFAFKQKLTNAKSGAGNAADLGMVKNDYSEWYVIEVELGKHTLTDVTAQIETFKYCVYTSSNSDYILKERPTVFDQQKLEALITGKAPKLMVIVNEEKADWVEPLKALGCMTCVFQIYNDMLGRYLYRLDGEYPFVALDFCNCKYEKEVAYVVKVLKRDFLDGYGIPNGSTVQIDFNGVLNKWVRRDSGSKVYLVCESPYPPLDSFCYRYKLNYSEKTMVSSISVDLPKDKKNRKKPRFIKATSTVQQTTKIPYFTFTKD